MKLVVAAEVCSWEMMSVVKRHLIAQGHEVIDLGMQSQDQPMVFYEIAPMVARYIQEGKAERGLLMCGTGNGVCTLASKFKGVYPALAESATAARLHRVINRSNVLCMGAWIVGQKTACDMVDAWLSAEIGEGFDQIRRKRQAEGFARLQEIERENLRPL